MECSPWHGDDTEKASLRDLAISLAEEAGELVRRRLLLPRVRVEHKVSVNDIATEVDHDAEALIVDRLSRLRPDDGILAEEDHASASRSGLTWVIDPLDGSANYLHRHPPFGVSIAVCSSLAGLDVVPVAAALHDVAHRETFSAAVGSGATLNGQALAPSGVRRLTTAIVGTGFSHVAQVRRAEAELLPILLPAIGDLRRSGSGAIDLCWVACGRLDAFYQAGLKVWDFAAAQLILAESGAWFKRLPGIGGSDAVIAASAPGIRQALVDLLETAGVGR